MWRSSRPSVKSNEVYRSLPALVGLFGIFILELMRSHGIALWIDYALPLWYISRVSRKPAFALPSVAFICSGLIIAGHALSPRGMDEFYAAVNQTIGVLFLWGYSLLLIRFRDADERLYKIQENPPYSDTQFRAMAHVVLPLPRHHHMYASTLLSK